MKALVTGGSGFIGSHVVRALLDAGHQVRVLDLPGSDLRNLRGLPVEWVAGDVTDRRSVEEAVRGCEWVFHLAAIYALWMRRPARMREVNVQGTRNVLEAASRARVRGVVHTSSIAVFGGQGPDRDATEESPFALGATGDLYSRTKYEAHQVAREYAARGLDVRIVCPTGPLGPGDRGPTPTGRALLSALQLPVAVVLDTCSNVADVRDIATGHVLAMERGEPGESYLLGGRNAHMSELAHLALATARLHKPVVRAPFGATRLVARGLRACSRLTGRPPLLTPEVVSIAKLGLRARCDKAVRELGLPRRPLAVSIRDALVWFAREGFLPSGLLSRLVPLPLAPEARQARPSGDALERIAHAGHAQPDA